MNRVPVYKEDSGQKIIYSAFIKWGSNDMKNAYSTEKNQNQAYFFIADLLLKEASKTN